MGLLDFPPLLTGLFIFLYRLVRSPTHLLLLLLFKSGGDPFFYRFIVGLTKFCPQFKLIEKHRLSILTIAVFFRSTISILTVAGNSLVIYVVFTSRFEKYLNSEI